MFQAPRHAISCPSRLFTKTSPAAETVRTKHEPCVAKTWLSKRPFSSFLASVPQVTRPTVATPGQHAPASLAAPPCPTFNPSRSTTIFNHRKNNSDRQHFTTTPTTDKIAPHSPNTTGLSTSASCRASQITRHFSSSASSSSHPGQSVEQTAGHPTSVNSDPGPLRRPCR